MAPSFVSTLSHGAGLQSHVISITRNFSLRCIWLHEKRPHMGTMVADGKICARAKRYLSLFNGRLSQDMASHFLSLVKHSSSTERCAILLCRNLLLRCTRLQERCPQMWTVVARSIWKRCRTVSCQSGEAKAFHTYR